MKKVFGFFVVFTVLGFVHDANAQTERYWQAFVQCMPRVNPDTGYPETAGSLGTDANVRPNYVDNGDYYWDIWCPIPNDVGPFDEVAAGVRDNQTGSCNVQLYLFECCGGAGWSGDCVSLDSDVTTYNQSTPQELNIDDFGTVDPANGSTCTYMVELRFWDAVAGGDIPRGYYFYLLDN